MSDQQQTVNEKDIFYLEYDAWVLYPDGTEVLFDTTSEENAKAADTFDEKVKYGEMPMMLGQQRVFPGLENALKGAQVGKDIEIEIPPADGAGERDPRLVEIHSVAELRKKNIVPEMGAEIEMDNKKGRVVAVTPGRVRVDFNNFLAGRTLKYKFKVTKIIQTPHDKVVSIIGMDYGNPDEFKVKIHGEGVDIVLPEICKYDQSWFVTKYRVVSDLRELLEMKKVRFIEEYEKKEEEPAEQKEEAAPAEPTTSVEAKSSSVDEDKPLPNGTAKTSPQEASEEQKEEAAPAAPAEEPQETQPAQAESTPQEEAPAQDQSSEEGSQEEKPSEE